MIGVPTEKETRDDLEAIRTGNINISLNPVQVFRRDLNIAVGVKRIRYPNQGETLRLQPIQQVR